MKDTVTLIHHKTTSMQAPYLYCIKVIQSSRPELLTTITSLNVMDSKLQKYYFIKQNSKTPLV
jgi:hypothetical protein